MAVVRRPEPTTSSQRPGSGRTVTVAAALAVAVAARLAYGAGDLGYDPAFNLLWGRDLADLRLPDFQHPATPTPHPLAHLVNVAVAPLGLATATEALRWLTALSLGALAVACARLAGRLFGTAAGLVAATIVATRPEVVANLERCGIDVPFLALAVSAAAIAVRRPGALQGSDPSAGAAVTGLLLLAGLLRPEAWPAAAVCGGVLAARAGGRRRAALLVAAVAAPVIWAATDLLLTGDALFSFSDTRAAADGIGRPRTVGVALENVPLYLRVLLGDAVFWTGLAGLGLVLWRAAPRALAPGVLVVSGVVALVGLGAAGLPVLPRYALVPMVGLACFAGALLGGAPSLVPAARRRAALAGASLLLVAVAALDVAWTGPELGDARREAAAAHRSLGDLRRLLARPAVRSSARACPTIVVPGGLTVPYVVLWLERPIAQVTTYRFVTEPLRSGLVVVPATSAAAEAVRLRGTLAGPPLGPGFSPLARSRGWRVLARCAP